MSEYKKYGDSLAWVKDSLDEDPQSCTRTEALACRLYEAVRELQEEIKALKAER